MLLEPVKKSAVVDEPVLDHLGQARAQFARREGCQRTEVRNHGTGLMKRPDQVLAARVIHAGLAADGGIDLRQQRRRHLHEIDAALITGRRKSGDVADHAAAECDDAGVAIQPGAHERVEDLA